MVSLVSSLHARAATTQSGASVRTDEERAQEAMEQGVASYARGDAEAALGQYELAKTLAPRANLPYRYAAEALIVLKRYPEAVRELEGYLAKNPFVSDHDEVEKRIVTLRREHFPGRLYLQMRTDVRDATVMVDDTVVSVQTWLQLQPGIHRLVIVGPSVQREERTVEILGDEDQTKVLDPVPTHTVPAEKVSPLTTLTKSPSVWQTLGWVGVGLGSVTLVTSLSLDLTYLKKAADDYDSAIRSEGDTFGASQRASEARTWVVMGYVVGASFAVTGALFLLLAPHRPLRDAAYGTFRF